MRYCDQNWFIAVKELMFAKGFYTPLASQLCEVVYNWNAGSVSGSRVYSKVKKAQDQRHLRAR